MHQASVEFVEERLERGRSGARAIVRCYGSPVTESPRMWSDSPVDIVVHTMSPIRGRCRGW